MPTLGRSKAKVKKMMLEQADEFNALLADFLATVAF